MVEEIFFPPVVVFVGGRHRQSSICSPTPTMVSHFPVAMPSTPFGFLDRADCPAPSRTDWSRSSCSSSSSASTLHNEPLSLSPTKQIKHLLSKKTFFHFKASTSPSGKGKLRASACSMADDDEDLDFADFLKSGPPQPQQSATSPIAPQPSAADRKQAKADAKLEKLREIVRMRNEKIDRQEAKKQSARAVKLGVRAGSASHTQQQSISA